MKNLKLIISMSEELLKELMSKIDGNTEELDVEHIVPLTLYNSIIEMSKSVLKLWELESFAGVESITRSIQEKSVVLEFIVSKDSTKRARAFYLSTQLRQLEFRRVLIKNDNLKIIGNSYGGEEKFKPIIDYKYDNEEDLLARYFELTNSEKSKDWYKVASKKINSFRDLCEFVSEEAFADYLTAYALLSQEVHGKDLKSYFEADENYFSLTYKKPSDISLAFVRINLLKSFNIMAKYFNINSKGEKIKKRYSYQFKLNAN